MNELSHPWARLGGVIIAACIVFFLDTTSTDALHKLWLPLGLAFSAFLMTQALMAVAFACLVMAGLNIDLGLSQRGGGKFGCMFDYRRASLPPAHCRNT